MAEADALVSEVVRERADPDAKDFESGRRLPCRQPSLIVEHYRAANGISTLPTQGDARGGASASAMVHLRALFDELLAREDRVPVRNTTTVPRAWVSSEGPRSSQRVDGRAGGRERRDRGTPRA